MSYLTLKNQLTGINDNKDSLHIGLDQTKLEIVELEQIKEGIITAILIPAKAIMTEYIQARQQYLNDTAPTGRRGSNKEGEQVKEWRSNLTDGFTGLSASDTGVCAYTEYGLYNSNNGLISPSGATGMTYSGDLTAGKFKFGWALEHWRLYSNDPDHAQGASTFFYAPCAEYMDHLETFNDITHSKLASLTSSPYSLDGDGRHSLSNLKQLTADWVTGMSWIWATNQQYTTGDPLQLNPLSSYFDTYNTWGINQNIVDYNTAVDALCADLAFRAQQVSLNTRY